MSKSKIFLQYIAIFLLLFHLQHYSYKVHRQYSQLPTKYSYNVREYSCSYSTYNNIPTTVNNILITAPVPAKTINLFSPNGFLLFKSLTHQDQSTLEKRLYGGIYTEAIPLFQGMVCSFCSCFYAFTVCIF